MKIKLKKVYYCDFCKKKGMSASAMSLHEKHCTGNPDRECRLCMLRSNSPYAPKVDYREVYKKSVKGKKFTERLFADLDDELNCPACVLTVLRMRKLPKERDYNMPFYDFKVKLEEFMSELNTKAQEAEEYDAIYG